MNLIFLFSREGLPMLVPANICKFNRKDGTYVTQDESKKLADTSTEIDSEFRNNMYGVKFKNYSVIHIDNYKNFKGKACFLIYNDGTGYSKFVIFFLRELSIYSIVNNGIILTRDILIGCGISRHDGYSISPGCRKVTPLYSYVKKRNLLQHETYEVILFVYPQGLPQVSYRRTVEDTERHTCLPLIQKRIAMLFNHVFDIQLIGPLVEDMHEGDAYYLDYFNEKGNLFYTRKVTKNNVTKTIKVSTVDIVQCIGSAALER